MKINEVTVNEAGPNKPNPLDLQPLEGGGPVGGGYSSGGLPSRVSITPSQSVSGRIEPFPAVRGSPKIGLSGTQSNVPGTLRVGTVDKPPVAPTNTSATNLQTRLDKMQGQDIPTYQRAAKPEPNVANKPSVWKDPRTGEVTPNPPPAVAQAKTNQTVNRLDPRYKPENDPGNYTPDGKYKPPVSSTNSAQSSLNPSQFNRAPELPKDSILKTAGATAGLGTALALAGGGYLDAQRKASTQQSQPAPSFSQSNVHPKQSSTATSTSAEPTTTSAPTSQAPSSSDIKTQGVTGAELARTSGGMFMNKADRLNQDKVDAALGSGYKAGSKEANLALAAKFRGDQTASADNTDKDVSEDGGKKWIQKAIKHPGALTRKAKAAGQSTQAFAKAHAHDKGITGKQARLAQTLAKMHETKESKIMNIKESINFKELMANADADVQAMLIELQNDVEMFKETGQSSDLLDSFLKVHLHNKKKIADEAMFDEEVGAGRGVVNPPVVNPNAPVPPARTASPGWGKDDYKPLVPDTSTVFKPAVTDPEGVKEAGSFIRGLASSRKTFEGKEMKDVQFESWEKELNSLLNEGITVSTSTGQQGAPDSVSINATDNDANELLTILRQSGMGVFGAEEKPSMSPYGVISQGEEEPTGTGTEPQASPTVVGDGDDMLSLIKKMAGIGGDSAEKPEGTMSVDYEDEGAEDHECETCGKSPCECDHEEGEEVDEGYQDTDEGAGVMHFKKQQAEKSGQDHFELGDKTYPVKEDDMEEGNKFGLEVVKAKEDDIPDQHQKIKVNGKEYPVKEEEETCNECGMYESECGCDHVEEGFSNDAGGDAMGDTEMAKLKALLAMGGDLHKMKHDQTVLNPTRVSVREAINDWKKLSGIK